MNLPRYAFPLLTDEENKINLDLGKDHKAEVFRWVTQSLPNQDIYLVWALK